MMLCDFLIKDHEASLCVLSCSVVFDSATPWTVAHWVPLPIGFSSQDPGGLPFPTPGDLPDSDIEPMSLESLALAGSFFATSTTWEVLEASTCH